jgi:hypothetical protein
MKTTPQMRPQVKRSDAFLCKESQEQTRARYLAGAIDPDGLSPEATAIWNTLCRANASDMSDDDFRRLVSELLDGRSA